MESLSVEFLKPDSAFTDDVLIDSTLMLLPKSATLTENMIKILKKWGFESVLCDGTLSLEAKFEPEEDEEEIAEETQSEEAHKEKLTERVLRIIQESKSDASVSTEAARIGMVRNVYDEYMRYINSMYTHYVTHKEIDQEELSEGIQYLCVFIKDHRRYILRINENITDTDMIFLVPHAMRSTVLAIAIGMQLHMPLSKLIDLGVTCILHEIGMVQIPPQLYLSDKKLSTFERTKLSKHTVLGYLIAKNLKFPLSVQLGILEHHENENASGYPRRLPSDKISSIAKIISVVCAYEAITSPRKYRDARPSFDALLELLQNKEHKYNNIIINALIHAVSLYPIGTYVYLSNRKVAEVIDSNQENPKCPVVQLLTETEKDGSPKVMQTDANISILRILSSEEKRDVLKMLAHEANPEPEYTALEEITDDEIADAGAQANFAADTGLEPLDEDDSLPAEPQTPPKSPENPEDAVKADKSAAAKTEGQLETEKKPDNQKAEKAAESKDEVADKSTDGKSQENGGIEEVDINFFS